MKRFINKFRRPKFTSDSGIFIPVDSGSIHITFSGGGGGGGGVSGLDVKFAAEKEGQPLVKTEIKPDWTINQILKELLVRWDGLGEHKDDDFGEVQAVIEVLRAKMNESTADASSLKRPADE